jgi:hypothetical protein
VRDDGNKVLEIRNGRLCVVRVKGNVLYIDGRSLDLPVNTREAKARDPVGGTQPAPRGVGTRPKEAEENKRKKEEFTQPCMGGRVNDTVYLGGLSRGIFIKTLLMIVR